MKTARIIAAAAAVLLIFAACVGTASKKDKSGAQAVAAADNGGYDDDYEDDDYDDYDYDYDYDDDDDDTPPPRRSSKDDDQFSDPAAPIDTRWYSAEKDTFTINTPAELAGMAKLVNRDNVLFRNKTFILGRDIIINDTANWKDWAKNPPPRNWTAIGTDRRRFAGTFDGNGHTVSGLYIKNPKDDQGLFGVIGYTGAVKSLSVKAAYVDGGDYAGILAGDNAGSIIGCSTGGIVAGDSIVGGLTGVNDGAIWGSYSAGAVTGRVNTGGFMGANRGGTASGNYSSATVAGNIVTGGFAGANWGGTFIGNFSVGKVTGKKDAGGFIGCHYSGTMRNNYYDTETSGQQGSGKGEGRTTAQMRSRETADSLNSAAGVLSAFRWQHSEKAYPALSKKTVSVNIGGYFAGGDGTEAAPYAIRTKKQLEDFSMLVNAGERFAGKRIMLAQDIALNDTANWRDWAVKPPAYSWHPIGTTASTFDGTFDGGGHAVSGVYVDNPMGDFIGFFGLVSKTAVIKNLGVVASYLRGGGAVGGLIGGNGASDHIDAGGQITNCYVIAAVVGEGYNIGGLTGRNDGGTISNSYSAGTVAAGEYAGGLVGVQMNGGTISNSYSIADVNGDSLLGGLVGVHHKKSTISNSYAAGSVTGKKNTGGLVGWSCWRCDMGEVTDSYYDSSASSQRNAKEFDDKRFGRTAEQMKNAANFYGWDFRTVWGIDSKVNNGYPHLLKKSGDAAPQTTNWYSANPQATVFTISTAEELAELADIVNGTAPGIKKDNFRGKTVKLAKNIDLRQAKYYTWVPIGKYANVWRENEDKSFFGTFDGGGHVISNLSAGSLFGYIRGGTIKNLGIENVDISSGKSTGGLAIDADDTSTIIGCHTTGTIYGGENTGGLVGVLTRGSRIINSYSTVAVSSDERNIGGLAGTISDSHITDSYAAGPVSGEWMVGGLVGWMRGTVTSSYALGEVTGTRRMHMSKDIGGLIGTADDKTRVFASAALGPKVTSGTDGVLGRVAGSFTNYSREYYHANNGAWAGMENRGGSADWPAKNATKENGEDIPLAQIMADPTIGGRFTKENGWTLEKGKLPGLRGKAVPLPEYMRKASTITPDMALVLKGREQRFDAAFNGKFGSAAVRWALSGNTSKSTTINSEGKLTVAADEGATSITVTAVSKADAKQKLSAEVTIKEAPDHRWYSKNPNAQTFSVSTANELAGLAEIVNGTWGGNPERDNFSGKTIKLAKDIDLSPYDNWIPIGNYSADTLNVFSGTLNGGGRTISSLTTNNEDDRFKDYREIHGIPIFDAYQGLFGRLSRGRVESLTLDGLNVNGTHQVGGIAGALADSSAVVSCRTSGTIDGMGGTPSNIGGIAGAVSKGSRVEKSSSGCSVRGFSRVGGIAGSLAGGSVSSCYSTGGIHGSLGGAGGIAGEVDRKSRITGSYSTSAVKAFDKVGGIAGVIAGRGSIINCAALNSQLSVGRDPVGRLVSEADRRTTLTNNAAYNAIQDEKGKTGWYDDKEAVKNITAAQIKADGSIGGRFTEKDGWTVENGKLPGFGGKAVEMPEHLKK